jgi:hypothetical protein
MTTTAEFDVFLSHNSKDKEAVERLALRLKQRNLRVWLDKWEMPPGSNILQTIAQGIANSRKIAVFLGPHSLGKWENPEMQIAITNSIQNVNKPVFGVVLPGAPDDKTLANDPSLSFLNLSIRAYFRNGLEDGDAFADLVWGITGVRPEPENQPVPPTVDPERQAIEDAIQTLGELLERDNVTFLIGPGASFPPRACEITRALLRELNFPLDECQDLLPPVDIAGAYYAIKVGEARLENRIVDIIMQCYYSPPSHSDVVFAPKREF